MDGYGSILGVAGVEAPKIKKHAYISVFFESGSVVVMLDIEGCWDSVGNE